MAQKVVVSLVDDLDQSEADETVEFGIDGATYEIDLSEANASALRDALADYVAHARRSGGRRRSSSASSSGSTGGRRGSGGGGGRAAVDREQNQAIREWARKQGMTVSERGRIPSEVSEAYHKAH
ncbi:histone-like nucleoid-structuring protein Lsr2 [Actinomycetospora straminea]|uniref:Lsr2 family protein n=1 Tax=Actinomycetospora straminea TaxID=663607 RepID=A0ABP9E9D7_9PSEU|nr:Lsr2 family protein [Actinomycetospora straminea]MDD7931881.1 Lsr2 family protein [Actinomycetospora straminea]